MSGIDEMFHPTNQLDGIRKLRNSSANDEGRALLARWRAKMCHGGFNTAVSHLLISDLMNKEEIHITIRKRKHILKQKVPRL